jgi:hypothetical protein
LVVSQYSKLNNPEQLQKTRFVDRFNGASLDERWQISILRGTGTVAVQDDIDEGINIQALGTPSPQFKSKISFGGIRHYSETGSVLIGIWRGLETTDNPNKMALINVSSDVANTNFVQTQGAGSFNLVADDGTTTSSSNGSAYTETDFNLFKIEITPSVATLIANGILEISHTTNLPTARLEPTFQQNSQVANVPKNMRVRYAEAYET